MVSLSCCPQLKSFLDVEIVFEDIVAWSIDAH